jgi:hypothetical protein
MEYQYKSNKNYKKKNPDNFGVFESKYFETFSDRIRNTIFLIPLIFSIVFLIYLYFIGEEEIHFYAKYISEYIPFINKRLTFFENEYPSNTKYYLVSIVNIFFSTSLITIIVIPNFVYGLTREKIYKSVHWNDIKIFLVLTVFFSLYVYLIFFESITRESVEGLSFGFIHLGLFIVLMSVVFSVVGFFVIFILFSSLIKLIFGIFGIGIRVSPKR